MAMVYKWKPYASVTGLTAQAAGEELERIRSARGGNLIAADVLKEARKSMNPLHTAFEWDDKKAAHHYRLSQAGDLIRAIVIVDSEKPHSEPVRAFVSVGERDDAHFNHVTAAMSDTVQRAQVIARAWKELEDWRRRYEGLLEFSKLFELVDQTTPTISKAA